MPEVSPKCVSLILAEFHIASVTHTKKPKFFKDHLIRPNLWCQSPWHYVGSTVGFVIREACLEEAEPDRPVETTERLP